MITITRLKCAQGLADLANSDYKHAAKNFLGANLDHSEMPAVSYTHLTLPTIYSV